VNTSSQTLSPLADSSVHNVLLQSAPDSSRCWVLPRYLCDCRIHAGAWCHISCTQSGSSSGCSVATDQERWSRRSCATAASWMVWRARMACALSCWKTNVERVVFKRLDRRKHLPRKQYIAVNIANSPSSIFDTATNTINGMLKVERIVSRQVGAYIPHHSVRWMDGSVVKTKNLFVAKPNQSFTYFYWVPLY